MAVYDSSDIDHWSLNQQAPGGRQPEDDHEPDHGIRHLDGFHVLKIHARTVSKGAGLIITLVMLGLVEWELSKLGCRVERWCTWLFPSTEEGSDIKGTHLELELQELREESRERRRQEHSLLRAKRSRMELEESNTSFNTSIVLHSTPVERC